MVTPTAAASRHKREITSTCHRTLCSLEKSRGSFVYVDVHDRRADLVHHVEDSQELTQARVSDRAKRGAKRQKPGGVRYHAELVAFQGRSDRGGIEQRGVGRWRLQRQVYEIESASADPGDLFREIPAGVVHGTDLHVSLAVL